jgi:Xaa-Pro aminopeptidase
MVLNHFAAPLARRDSWLDRIELYDGYSESPYQKAAEVLAEMGLSDSRVGFERTYLSAARWDEVRRLLPAADITDCTALMAEVRWIKTEQEVELLKQAADILDDAYLEVFHKVREGDTEREVHSRIVKSCIQRGAQWVHGMLSSSRNTVSYGGEGDTRFKRGDIIRNDYVSYYLGYPGHQNRTIVVGEPSAEQRRAYRAIRDIYRATIDQCRVGAVAGDVYQYAVDAFRQEGYDDRVNLVGHGVGAWWHQQEPYLVEHAQQVLEAGMVLALEPGVSYWRLQDLILVTEGAPRLLSTRFNTDEMFVTG